MAYCAECGMPASIKFYGFFRRQQRAHIRQKCRSRELGKHPFLGFRP
jgi:hypothetical protein